MHENFVKFRDGVIKKSKMQKKKLLTMSNLELIELIYFKMRIIFEHTSSMIFQNKPQNIIS